MTTHLTEPATAHWSTKEDAEALQIGSNLCRVLLPGEATGGLIGAFSLTLPAGGPVARPHVHERLNELFVVTAGRVRLQQDTTIRYAATGSSLFVPPGVAHGFANDGDEPAELLIVFTPGDDRENYFRGLVELGREGLLDDEDSLRRWAERFDQFDVSDPADLHTDRATSRKERMTP